VAVHVTIPVQSTATTRTVPVLWQLRGEVATGYWVSRVTTDPLTVTLSGDRTVIASLDRIETSPIDVSGLSAGRTFAASLVVPSGVKVLGDTELRVAVTVVALIGTRPFPLVAVRALDLGPDLAATVTPGTVDIVLSGTVPVLAAIGADGVSAVVDAAGRGPGTYSLDVTVRAPAGASVQSVQPARVTVTIRSTRPPSPTPASS
jgi:YbbR domain-containing protein